MSEEKRPDFFTHMAHRLGDVLQRLGAQLQESPEEMRETLDKARASTEDENDLAIISSLLNMGAQEFANVHTTL